MTGHENRSVSEKAVHLTCIVYAAYSVPLLSDC